jgi:hypothetical protein
MYQTESILTRYCQVALHDQTARAVRDHGRRADPLPTEIVHRRARVNPIDRHRSWYRVVA